MRHSLFAGLIATAWLDAHAQSSLPPCEGQDVYLYSSCYATWADGAHRYVGEWSGGKYHGQGVLTIWPGMKYVGEFREGRFHGRGTLTIVDTLTYVGEFQGGEKEGQGIQAYSDGRKYVGAFKKSEFSGQGTFTWPDGRELTGDFSWGGRGTDDRFEAKGHMKWPNGATFDGEIFAGVPNGNGTLSFPDGSVVSGYFENGRLNR